MTYRQLHVTYATVEGSGQRPQIALPADAAALLTPRLASAAVEHFGVLSLDTKRRVIGWDVISIGTLDASIVHPRDVFRTAILHNASAIVVAHNHPSGDPAPSQDDVAMTTRLVRAGELMGIPVLDHVIVGEGGRYWSHRASGLLADGRAA